MKTALVFFRSPMLEFDGEYYSRVVETFRNGGVEVDVVEMLSITDESVFRRRFDEFKDTADNVIIIDANKQDFNVKEIICEKNDTVLVENENAKRFLDAVCKADGIEYCEDYANLPVEATVIPNVRGAYQGFILDTGDTVFAVLPDEFYQLKPMCDSYLIPYFENKYGIKSKRLILKYFGDRRVLEKTLANAVEENRNVIYSIHGKYGDTTIELLFKDGVDEDLRGHMVRTIVGELKEDIYAEFDTTLGERLFDVLKLKKLKLAVAESFTGGRVVSDVIKNPGASEFVTEGAVTYSNASKMKRLGVIKDDLMKSGAVSSVVAYQMAAGLLRDGSCDVAIATTGIAGPKSDDTEKPVGLCYIAVGMKDGVHTYRYQFTGSREEITETAKNTALFLAIKKLKNI